MQQAQRQQHDGCRNAGRGIARQDADRKRGDAHDAHGDQKRVLAADQIAEPPEYQRPERPNCEPRCECGQRENETGGFVDTREKLRAYDGREQTVQVKVVPLEHGAERGGADDQPIVLWALLAFRQCACCCADSHVVPSVQCVFGACVTQRWGALARYVSRRPRHPKYLAAARPTPPSTLRTGRSINPSTIACNGALQNFTRPPNMMVVCVSLPEVPTVVPTNPFARPSVTSE